MESVEETPPTLPKTPRFEFGGFCLLVAVIAFAVQQGCAVTGNPTSWLWGIFWFLFVAAAAIIGVWMWDHTAKRHWIEKTIISIFLLLFVGRFSYDPIIEQYKREHPHQIAAVPPQEPPRPILEPPPSNAADEIAARENKKTSAKTSHRAIPTRKEKGETMKQPAATAPASSSATNTAPGGIANSGTIGQATVIHNEPTERHLTPLQTSAIDSLALSLPESAPAWLVVETSNDVDSSNYAGEIYNIFLNRGKISQNNLITRLSERPPVPKGVFVVVTNQQDAHFSSAQQIANTFTNNGIPIKFSTAAGLKPGEVKIIVFRQ